MRPLILAAILSACAGPAKAKQVVEPKPLTPCQEWKQDMARVCAHQGPLLCKPSVILCAGETMTFPIK